MKLLILGGNGMIGHTLLERMMKFHTVKATLKKKFNEYHSMRITDENYYIDDINVLDFNKLEFVIKKNLPEVIINAIGISKQKILDYNKKDVEIINSLFPHKLAKLCKSLSIKLIHLSTDCVFSGKKGFYTLDDEPDAEDLYGVSKYKGEINDASALTIRKSTIGFEINYKKGLLEWFIKQTGHVDGYKNAIFSGITTLEFAKVLLFLFEKKIDLRGVYHISTKPIDKHTLLNIIKDKLELDTILIRPYKEFVCDRSLDGGSFLEKTNYKFPTWEIMIDEMLKFHSSKVN